MSLALLYQVHYEILQLQSTTLLLTNDFFSNIGKIYVVVAVIVIIFIGLVIYLWRLDQRLSSIEKKIHESTKRRS